MGSGASFNLHAASVLPTGRRAGACRPGTCAFRWSRGGVFRSIIGRSRPEPQPEEVGPLLHGCDGRMVGDSAAPLRPLEPGTLSRLRDSTAIDGPDQWRFIGSRTAFSTCESC